MRSKSALPFSIASVLAYLGFAIVVAIIGLPLLWMVLASFKESAEIYQIPVTWFPQKPTLMNYPDAWNAVPFATYFRNSISPLRVQLARKCCSRLVVPTRWCMSKPPSASKT